ncbi:DUF11 domain-containing protein [Chloroflexia bacterium SDU3-3]|nr:DUF11 domain-containing protein [Chloroflexia bacterium SDU3-3]
MKASWHWKLTILGSTIACAAMMGMQAAQATPPSSAAETLAAQGAAAQGSEYAFTIDHEDGAGMYRVATGKLVRNLMPGDDLRPTCSIAAGDDNVVSIAKAYSGSRAQIFRFNASTGRYITTLSPDAELGCPKLLAGEGRTLYALSTKLKLYQIDPKTGDVIGTLFDLSSAYPDPSTPSFTASDVKIGPHGYIYLLDNLNKVIVRFDPRAKAFLSPVRLDAAGQALGWEMAFAPDGSFITIEDPVNRTGTSGPYKGKIFHFSTSGALLRAVETDIELANCITYGPKDTLYVCDQHDIKRFSWPDGKPSGSFLKKDLTTDLVFAGHGKSRHHHRATMGVVQRAQPSGAVRTGEQLTYTIVVRNHGQGSSQTTRATLGLDPALVQLLSASFSRGDSWVREASASQVTLSFGPMRPGDTLTATVVLQVLPTAPVGATIGGRLTTSWDDAADGGAGQSNLAQVTVAEQAASAPAATLAIATADGGLRIRAQGFIPGEPVALWANTTGGAVAELPRTAADDEGALDATLAPATLAPGSFASLVAHGVWSGTELVGAP